MITLTYLAPIRAGRNAGTFRLVTITSPNAESIYDVFLCLDRRHAVNPRLWRDGKLWIDR